MTFNALRNTNLKGKLLIGILGLLSYLLGSLNGILSQDHLLTALSFIVWFSILFGFIVKYIIEHNQKKTKKDL